MEKKWITNATSCSIPHSIKGVRQYLVMHLDLPTYYGNEPSTFGRLSSNRPNNDDRSVFLHLYWKLLERIKEESVAKLLALQKKNKGAHDGGDGKSDNKHLRPIQMGDGEDEKMVPIAASDENKDGDSSGDEAQEVSESEAEKVQLKEDGSKKRGKGLQLSDSENEDNDEEILLDQISNKMMELYIETVPTITYSGIGSPDDISGYRFWSLIFHPQIDANKIFAEMIKKITELNNFLVSGGQGKKNRDDNAKSSESSPRKFNGRGGMTIQPWEEWKKISTRAQLAAYCDQYKGYQDATANAERNNIVSMEDPSSLISATGMWSYGWAMNNTSLSTYRRQGIENFDWYIRTNEYDNTSEIRFPMRKLVYKVQMDDISPYVLHTKYLLHTDKQSVSIYIKVLPALLEDPKIFADQLDEKDEVRDEETKKEELSEENRKLKEEKARLDNLRNTILRKYTNSNVNVKESRKFDAKDLLACKWSIIDQIFGASATLTDTLTSCYAPLYGESKRNLNKLRVLHTKRASLEFFKKLKNPTRVSRILYMLNQINMLSKYITSCRSDKANLSPSAKAIFNYIETTNLYENNNLPEEKFDLSLTSFATSECRFYQNLEKTYKLINSFPCASLAYKNSLDAYTMHFDRIHNHMITYSESGNTGKSFIWRLLYKHWRIPNTINWLTYESAKARATENHNMNDEVVVFDEIEQALLDKNGGGGNDKERTFKQLLANNKVSAKILTIDQETGKRETKITFSECITLFFGSMNVPFDQMSESMSRRFHQITMSEVPYEDCSILEIETIAQVTDNSGFQVYVGAENRKHHLIQAMTCEIEKMIYVGILSEVSMEVGSVIMLCLSNELMTRGYTEPNPTMYERIITSARFNVIHDAIKRKFFNKGAQYQGKPIEVNQFRDLDPLLYCCCQHIICAIGESIDLVMDPIEHYMKIALRSIHMYNEDGGGKFKKKKFVVGNETIEATDATYLRFGLKYNKKNISTWICQQIALMPEAEIKPSPAAIEQRLTKWTKRNIRTYDYEFIRGKDGTVTPHKEQDNSVKDDSKIHITSSTKQTKQVAYWDEARAYYIHYEFIFPGLSKEYEHQINMGNEQLEHPRHHIRYIEGRKNALRQMKPGPEASKLQSLLAAQDLYARLDSESSPEDVVESILKDILSKKFQLPGRYVFTSERKQHSIRKIIEIPPPSTDARAQLLPVVKAINEINAKILTGVSNYLEDFSKKSFWFLDCDYDSYGMYQRTKLIYITPDPIDPIILKDNSVEDLFKNKKNEKKKKLDSGDSNIISMDISKDSLLFPGGDQSEEEEEEEENILNDGSEEVNATDEEPEENPEDKAMKDFERSMRMRFKGSSIYEDENMQDETNVVDDDTNANSAAMIPGDEDRDYDGRFGYYMGIRLDKLYVDDSKTMDKLTENSIRELYIKFDSFDENSVFRDVDFDPQRFIVSTTEDELDPTYHWDCLAKEGGISVGDWLRLRSDPLFDAAKTFTFVFIPEFYQCDEELRSEVLKFNIRTYKMIYTHPYIWDDLENKKYYSHLKETSGCYPSLFQTTMLTRRERWEHTRNIAGDSQTLNEKIGADQVYSFGYSKVVNPTTKEEEIRENKYCLQRLVSNISKKRVESELETKTMHLIKDASNLNLKNSRKRQSIFDFITTDNSVDGGYESEVQLQKKKNHRKLEEK